MHERFSPDLKITTFREFADYLNGKRIYPIHIEISPSGICQARCPECFYAGKQSGKQLESDLVYKLLDDFRSLGGLSVSWTGGGEPTLHKDFPFFIEYAYIFGLKQGLFTNALGSINYNPSLFEWIRVSKTNREFDLENLKKLRENARTVGININYKGIEKEVEDALDIADLFGLDYVSVRPALNKGDVDTIIEEPKIKHPKLIVLDYKFEEARKPREYTKCEGYHFVPFVWEDGIVSVCAYQRGDKTYDLGDLHSNSFKEIMDNAPDYVLVNQNCQRCCRNHEINKILHRAKNLKNREFI
jgi:MoaA/NifB/PqqE/SkfB family radical SAM enzyme